VEHTGPLDCSRCRCPQLFQRLLEMHRDSLDSEDFEYYENIFNEDEADGSD